MSRTVTLIVAMLLGAVSLASLSLASLSLGSLSFGSLSRSSALPSPAQQPEDTLSVYAVKVVKTPPLERPIVGYGIYLGQGTVITAAHVVGNWPGLTHPTVRVAGQDFATTVLKEGSFQNTDLALLAVDEAKLPGMLQLRQDPLCKAAPRVGMEVMNVMPQKVSKAHVISPLSIAPGLRRRYSTLIEAPRESGSGVFDPERRCLLGIVSAKVMKFNYQFTGRGITSKPDGFAGYFVPANQISNFVPQNLHF